MGRATEVKESREWKSKISIHALRGEGDAVLDKFAESDGISIHALRGEGDKLSTRIDTEELISIHALRGEGDSD